MRLPSIVSDIVGVLEVTDTIIDHINNLRNATRDQQNIALELSSIRTILLRFRFRVEELQADNVWLEKVNAIGVPDGPLDHLKEYLNLIAGRNVSISGVKRVKMTLLSQLDKDEVRELLTRVAQLKSVVETTILDSYGEPVCFRGTPALTERQNPSKTVGDGDIVQAGDPVRHLKDDKAHELRNDIATWLEISDVANSHNAVLPERQTGTRSWLLAHPDYRMWRDTPSSLWLFGDPGVGKTVLSANIVEDVRLLVKDQDKTHMAYFHFSFSDSRKQRLSSCFRSLAYQLSTKTASPPLFKLYDTYVGTNRQPSDEEIENVLQEIIAATTETFIIIDALNESTETGEVVLMLSRLMERLGQRLHVVVTSCWKQDIEAQILPVVTKTLEVQSTLVADDLRAYIERCLSKDDRLCRWPVNVRDEVCEKLLKEANGVFQWVDYQLKTIRPSHSLQKLRRRLDALPHTLGETYVRVLEQIDREGNLEEAILILQWLCFSMRPLKDEELLEVLGIDITTSGERFHADRCPRDFTEVISICSGLVSKRNDLEPSSLRHQGTEHRLAQFSVREYLLSRQNILESKFRHSHGHRVLAEACLTYLLYVCQEPGSVDEKVKRYPLARYAGEYWWKHLDSSGKKCNVHTKKLIGELLDTEHDYGYQWRKISGLHEGSKPRVRSHESPDLEQARRRKDYLYFAASIGRDEAIDSVVDRGVAVRSIDTEHIEAIRNQSARFESVNDGEAPAPTGQILRFGAGSGTALCAAAAEGHTDVVRKFLQGGISPDSPNKAGLDALCLAAQSGHAEVAELLLAHKARVNEYDAWVNSALHAAAESGHSNVLEILIQNKASVDGRSHSKQTPLNLALIIGHEGVVSCLLQHGANIRTQNEFGATPLHLASEHGRDQVVQYLLDQGVEIDLRDREGHTPLHLASSRGHQAVVELLLGYQADPTVKDLKGKLPLHLAAHFGHAEIALILVASGTPIDAFSPDCGSALHVASAQGHSQVVNLLIEHGASVEKINITGETPLHCAASKGHEETVRILLNHGANPNIQGGPSNTVLQAAARKGHAQVIKILLTAGVDITASGGKHGSALHASCSEGHLDGTKALLEHGIDVNKCNFAGMAPIHYASWKGHADMVQLLLDNGADVNARVPRYHSPLQMAALKGHLDVVRSLADAGADIHELGGESGSALHAACAGGHVEVVEFLLERGVDVNSQALGAMSWTPLAAATKKGKYGVILVLKRYGAKELGDDWETVSAVSRD